MQTIDPAAAQPTAQPGPSGIGGWLVLPLIGLLISPIIIGWGTYHLADVMRAPSWPELTTPGKPAYHPLYGALIPVEIAVNAALAIFAVVLIVLFLKRHPNVPKLMIAFYLINLAVVVVDTFAASFLPAFQFDQTAVRDIARALIAAVIWVHYFMLSKRVRNTFTAYPHA